MIFVLGLLGSLHLLGCSESGSSALGEPCLDSFECKDDLVCVNARGAAYCMETCDAANNSWCSDNRLCLAIPGESGACFEGGSIEKGNVCTDSVTCAKGLRCIQEGDAASCMSACDDEHSCASGEVCHMTGAKIGYCKKEATDVSK